MVSVRAYCLLHPRIMGSEQHSTLTTCGQPKTRRECIRNLVGDSYFRPGCVRSRTGTEARGNSQKYTLTTHHHRPNSIRFINPFPAQL
jgi:hypothetical protein